MKKVKIIRHMDDVEIKLTLGELQIILNRIDVLGGYVDSLQSQLNAATDEYRATGKVRAFDHDDVDI